MTMMKQKGSYSMLHSLERDMNNEPGLT